MYVEPVPVRVQDQRNRGGGSALSYWVRFASWGGKKRGKDGGVWRCRDRKIAVALRAFWVWWVGGNVGG